MRLILIRHGKTEWNAEHRIQGWLDSPLIDDAVQTLQEMSLPEMRHPVFYSSDLHRAHHSARILAERLGVNVYTDTRLRERGFGELQGRVIEQDPELFNQWLAYAQRYQKKMTGVAGIESEENFERRIRSFLQELSEYPTDSDRIVISHGEWIRACANILQGKESWREGEGVGRNGEILIFSLPHSTGGVKAIA